MSLASLSMLDGYKRTGSGNAVGVPDGYPTGIRKFYSPVDDVHGALQALIASARFSLVVAIDAFDDMPLAAAVASKLSDENVYVQLTLGISTAEGDAPPLMATQSYPASSVAIGHGERMALMHRKTMIVDGVDVVVGGFTVADGPNALQGSVLSVIRDPYIAAETRARVDTLHAALLGVRRHS